MVKILKKVKTKTETKTGPSSRPKPIRNVPGQGLEQDSDQDLTKAKTQPVTHPWSFWNLAERLLNYWSKTKWARSPNCYAQLVFM